MSHVTKHCGKTQTLVFKGIQIPQIRRHVSINLLVRRKFGALFSYVENQILSTNLKF